MGRYISNTGTVTTAIREVNSAYNAEVNDRIICDSSASSFTITLPANAGLIVEDVIQFIDVTGSFTTNPVTVARNGSLIAGLAEDLTLDFNGAIVTLMYSGPTYGWIIIGT